MGPNLSERPPSGIETAVWMRPGRALGRRGSIVRIGAKAVINAENGPSLTHGVDTDFRTLTAAGCWELAKDHKQASGKIL